MGPKLGGFPWLFPIFLPVEIASHLGRPVSLSLRLMGNILADHKVVLAIAGLIAVLAPVPFLLLGVLVDDAVVVSENTKRLRQEGLAPLDASIHGAGQVAQKGRGWWWPIPVAILLAVSLWLALNFVQKDNINQLNDDIRNLEAGTGSGADGEDG